MEARFSKRMMREDFQGDFVKMMLKAAAEENVISFAGGLPNPVSFPVNEIEAAAKEVLEKAGNCALQYSKTAGYQPLRAFIAGRYRRQGLEVSCEDILITNGSQQALDILSAVFIDEGDHVAVEDPAYLSALQTFSLHGAVLDAVALADTGADAGQLGIYTKANRPKFFYTVPTFQNPTGLTYTKENREKIAAVLKNTSTFLVEDNPYGELRFKGEEQDSFFKLLGWQCILFGTFSKIVSPGMRIGWICCADRVVREKMLDYKQVVDLHTNILGQMILSAYLERHSLDAHIDKIKKMYCHQAKAMIAALERYFPENVRYTKPEGGMFLWVTLPEGQTAVELGRLALEKGVAIAPGDPFYAYSRNVRSFRLNYTNCGDAAIEKGIAILGGLIEEMNRR